MDAPVTTVWIAPDAPDADQARALTSWGRSRGLRLVSPAAGAAKPLEVDPQVAEDVERMIDRAHDAIAARDGEAADRLLTSADSTLRAHPEIPQAAWLLAEVERTRATRLLRVPPVDEAAAALAWARAEALDGGRVAGVGEKAGAAPAQTASVTLELVPATAEARLDGVPVRGTTVSTHAGPHALVVSRQGAPVWAGWIDAAAGSSTVHVDTPAAPPCTSGDVGSARIAGDSVDASQVRCGAWVAAIPGPAGIRVALCETGRCGALVDWRAPLPWTYEPPPEGEHHRAWPAWATWGLVGAGAVVAGTIAVIASGVLKPAPTETQFVTGSVQKQ
jgi:hypothetical protein